LFSIENLEDFGIPGSFQVAVYKMVCPTLSDRCSILFACLSVVSCLSATLVYCGQRVRRIKMRCGLIT